MLHSKKIVLGITGSIAAYKAAVLVRLLVKAGAEVKIVMTSSATDFISPLTLATLSKNPVHQQFIKNEAGEWTNHVDLGLWADVMLIAPASANTIAKMANGICDNLLLAVYLSAKCPVMFAPAMDLDMWKHPATQANIEKLRAYGNILIDAETGELASGLEGKGRMAEPENILHTLQFYFEQSSALKNIKALVTAGPTYEALDPVRYIGNHSSGKMGYHIAEVLAKHGANVVLVSGPSKESVQHENISLIKVESADEMYAACRAQYDDAALAVFAAAVADYKPAEKANQKIKKDSDELMIRLTKNIDIAAEMGKLKKPGQLNIGFALETENEEHNAAEKLKRKNFDLIVLNSLNNPAAGFAKDTNKISILSHAGIKHFEAKHKRAVATDIVNEIIRLKHA